MGPERRQGPWPEAELHGGRRRYSETIWLKRYFCVFHNKAVANKMTAVIRKQIERESYDEQTLCF